MFESLQARVPCRRWPSRIRIVIVTGALLLSVAILILSPRVPLAADYHQFADRRDLLGFPNGLDALSSVPFVVVGVWGLWWVLRNRHSERFIQRLESLPYAVFFSGVALTGVGSWWYHLHPDNARLLWDLLPMACCFMALVSTVVTERIGVDVGLWAFVPLMALAVASVLFWFYTEARGAGDYRLYLFVQFAPPFLLSLIILLYPPRYSGAGYLGLAFLFFVLAKAFEYLDNRLYRAIRVSGHTLKHVTAAIACYWILQMLRRRHANDNLSTGEAGLVPLEYEDEKVYTSHVPPEKL